MLVEGGQREELERLGRGWNGGVLGQGRAGRWVGQTREAVETSLCGLGWILTLLLASLALYWAVSRCTSNFVGVDPKAYKDSRRVTQVKGQSIYSSQLLLCTSYSDFSTV